MAATQPEPTGASHARSRHNETPLASSFSPCSQFQVWWLVLLYGKLQKLGLPPMVTVHEEHEAPGCTSLFRFCLPAGPQHQSSPKAQILITQSSPTQTHHVQPKSPLCFISCLITSLHHTFHPSKLRTTSSFPKFLLNHSINFSLLFFSSFSSFYCCACMLVCVRHRSRCERGRTHRGVCLVVPRVGARRHVLRARAPGRIRK